MDSAFDRDTAVTKRDPGRYRATVSADWWVLRGPNGGYLAAIILRAITAEVNEPERAPRSLTVHYASAPGEGAVDLDVTVERKGRSLTTCSGRMTQQGRLVCLFVAALSLPRPGVEFCDVVMPQVPGPSAFVAGALPEIAPPVAHRYDMRWAIGHPPVPGVPAAARAVAGGWIRLPEPRPVDALLAAAITDAWIPPAFSRISAAVALPTVDLTIHFRAHLPHPGVAPDDFVLARFRTNVAHEGFLEEDGEVWASDGTLLAQSRQLATIVPFG